MTVQHYRGLLSQDNMSWRVPSGHGGRPAPHLLPVDRRVADHRDDRAGPAPAQRPDPALLRRALFGWAFNPGTRNLTPPGDTAAALAWIAAASLPVAALEEAATARLALDSCACTLASTSAAATTQRRKRAVFHNAVSYAVELRHLEANPVDRIGRKAPIVAQTVDRHVIAGPAQVTRLLAAACGLSDREQHQEALQKLWSEKR
jgi:hypothetical protein